MDMWTDIRRRVLVCGQSKRSVQRLYGIHWMTLNKILAHSGPPGYRQSKPRKRPKLEPFIPVILQWLEEDKGAHKKQRHTARRIFNRLVKEHGYQGGHTVVKDFVREQKRTSQEAFVPLIHHPGEAQVDFGHADVFVDGEQVKAALFVMTLPYSDAIFIQAYPRETTEAFLDGHIRAFAHLGGVPRRITFDNTTLAVAKVGKGRERTFTHEFSRLVSHHLFETHFCRVRKANEKGHVERLVDFARRNYLVPVPKVRSFAELNATLLEACHEDLQRTLRGKAAPKQTLLDDERGKFLPLPAERFEARRIVATRANSLSLVRFDSNDYSVPTEFAHHEVTITAGVDEVRIVAGSTLAARHRRIWKKERISFDPVHYLALLERKPGALDFARPLENWALPESLLLLRRRLESKLGHLGTREFIKCLRLLEHCSLSQLGRAVEVAHDLGQATPDSTALRVILDGLGEPLTSVFCLDGRPHLSEVRVAPPDLSGYRLLLDQAALPQGVAS